MSWKLKEFERSMFTVFEVIDENGEVIKTFVADQLTYAEKKKKAKLMAAAPELLEAAEEVVIASSVISAKTAGDFLGKLHKLNIVTNKAKGGAE